VEADKVSINLRVREIGKGRGGEGGKEKKKVRKQGQGNKGQGRKETPASTDSPPSQPMT